MHDVIGKGAAAIRRRKGWTQEQAARAYRNEGLTTWRTGTVGSLEAGLRRPGIDDVLRMCAALGTTLDGLIQAADEGGECMVELAPGVTASTRAIRDRLRPGDAPHPIPPSGTADAMPTESERHAARRLGTSPAEVRRAALALWLRSFDEERDARIGDATAMDPRSRQARRGHAAREMLSEIAEAVVEFGDDAAETAELAAPECRREEAAAADKLTALTEELGLYG
jgi:transcriptional regulator with XRE-family HTH domain